MAYRPLRHYRYQSLRYLGFLKTEARVLSKIPFKVPYMSALIGIRKHVMVQARKEKWTEQQYEAHILKYYQNKGWLKPGERLKVGNVYRMLRESENRYKDKHPEYESPWQKKRRTWKGFTRMHEKTMKKRGIKWWKE